MEPKGSSPYSKQHACCVYHETDNPVHALPFYLFKPHFNIIIPYAIFNVFQVAYFL